MVTSELQVGARVRIDSHPATVKFVGEVAGQAGSWVGLEWDDEARGKHDGCTAGVRYFTCKGRSGSFIRLQKFLQLAETGTQLSTALLQRYQGGAADDDGDLSIRTVSSRQLLVKLVGRDKVRARQAQLDSLRAANLAAGCISSVGHSGDLAAIAPGLAELDLGSNPLPSWKEVVRLADELPNLDLLNLSYCRMSFPFSTPEPKQFAALQTLVLNSTGISWGQVQAIEGSLPCLKQLHLCANALPALPQPLLGFTTLQVMSLNNNDLSTWATVVMLGSLPALQVLSLASNRLSNVEPPASGEQPGQALPFQRLQALLLADNALSSWSAVDALDSYPALTDARLSGNPLFADPNARAEVIARVAALGRLNGSTISAAERKDAELQYLRTVTGQLEAAVSSSAAQAMAGAHPRMQALRDKYGNVGAAVVNRLQGSVMRAGMVELTLRSLASGASHTKRLPGSMTVGKLKVLCERLFRIPVPAQVLMLHEQGHPANSIGDSDGCSLSVFDIQAPAEITVEQVDLEAAAAAAARAKQLADADHEHRMHQHDKDIQLWLALQEQQYKAAVRSETD